MHINIRSFLNAHEVIDKRTSFERNQMLDTAIHTRIHSNKYKHNSQYQMKKKNEEQNRRIIIKTKLSLCHMVWSALDPQQGNLFYLGSNSNRKVFFSEFPLRSSFLYTQFK